MAVKAIGVRSIGADVCSVLTIGGVGQQIPVAYDKIQTFTLVRRGDRWLCAAFQNTAMSQQAKSAGLLSVLVEAPLAFSDFAELSTHDFTFGPAVPAELGSKPV